MRLVFGGSLTVTKNVSPFLPQFSYCTGTGTVPRMGWGAAVPGQAGGGVDKGLRALSIKMKACLTREEDPLLVG